MPVMRCGLDFVMQADVALRPFDASSGLKDQRSLFRDCFHETIGQPAELDRHYLWKFHGFPARPPSYEYGAWLADDMIGYYAAIPYPYRIGGQTRTSGMVCDVMTGTRARGKGVFARLGAYALEQLKSAGLDFVTGYPIRPEVLPGHLKVGWKIVQTMPIFIKVLRTDALCKLRRLGLLSAPGNAGAAAINFLLSLGSPGNEYTSQTMTVDEFLAEEAYTAFLQEWMKGIPNALVKDKEFLKWRLGAPALDYRAFIVRDTSRALVAVCVARHAVLEKIPSLALLDLMVLPGHRRSFRLIDRDLRRYAAQTGSEVIATMIHPAWARHYGLGAMGYLKSPHVFSLIVKKLSATVDDASLFTSGRWHTMWIDSDDL
jgi:hypothetical protein